MQKRLCVDTFPVVVRHGRIFLNGQEHSAILRRDLGELHVSSYVTMGDLVLLLERLPALPLSTVAVFSPTRRPRF